MFDLILSKYWTPRHLPFWKYDRLPVVLMAIAALFAAATFEMIDTVILIEILVALVIWEFCLAQVARKRFGDKAPAGSRYAKSE